MPNTPLRSGRVSAILPACSCDVRRSRRVVSVTVTGTCAGRCAPRAGRVSRCSPRLANSMKRNWRVCAGAGTTCRRCCAGRLRRPGRSPCRCPASALRTQIQARKAPRRRTPRRVGSRPICGRCAWNAAATSASVTWPSPCGIGSSSTSCSPGFCPSGARASAGRTPPRCSPSRGFARNAPNSAWPSIGMTRPRSTICSASTRAWSTTTGSTARWTSSARTRTRCAAI